MPIALSTFSIVAADPPSGEVGIAVASKFLAVGAVVPWASATAGAVATQSYANTTFGPDGLRMLAEGADPSEILAKLIQADVEGEHRQVGMVSTDGRSASFTGSECMSWAGGLTGDCYAIQGNILTGPEVVEAMRDRFLSADGRLADRLLAALQAGDAAGGDSRGRQSAAVLVVRAGGGYAGFNDRYVDLRVDDHPDPIPELLRIRDIHRLYFDSVDERDLAQISPEMAQELQKIIRRSGAIPGDSSGSYDEATQAALKELFGRENLEGRWQDGAVIDAVAFRYLQAKFSEE